MTHLETKPIKRIMTKITKQCLASLFQSSHVYCDQTKGNQHCQQH